MPDTQTVEQTIVPFSFNIEIPDTLCGYVRFLHSDVTLRTTTLIHRSTNYVYCQPINDWLTVRSSETLIQFGIRAG